MLLKIILKIVNKYFMFLILESTLLKKKKNSFNKILKKSSKKYLFMTRWLNQKLNHSQINEIMNIQSYIIYILLN